MVLYKRIESLVITGSILMEMCLMRTKYFYETTRR